MRLVHGIRCIEGISYQNPLRIDMGCLPMVAEMNRNGILLDPVRLLELDEKLAAERDALRAEVSALAGRDINPGSGDQVAGFLFDDLGLPTLRQTASRRRPSVDEDTLVYLRDLHPAVNLILDYRGIDKLRGTYVGPLLEGQGPDGRIRTRLSMTVTRTGRLASEDPNLQNIPVRSDHGRMIRSAFVAGKGNRLASIDLSQIEMVVAAHDSQDPVMQEVYHRGEDIHTKTACAIFGLDYGATVALLENAATGFADEEEIQAAAEFRHKKRLPAKTLGFAVLYRTTPAGLQVQILQAGGPLIVEEECARYIERWFSTYAGVRTLMENLEAMAIRYGCVWNMFGRIRPMPAIRSRIRRVRSEAVRQACNHRIQSGAGDILKVGMIRVWELVRDWCQRYPSEIILPLLQIHDELLFELSRPVAEDFSQAVKRELETAVPLDVPVRAEAKVGEDWSELK